MELEKKICSQCLEEKVPILDFAWDKNKHKKICKVCQTKNHRERHRKTYGHSTHMGYTYGRSKNFHPSDSKLNN